MFKNNKNKSRILFFLLIFLCGIIALTALTMLLWNWLMPLLFHLSVISFWQALGLLALSKILFGGFRFCGKHRHRPPFANEGMKEKWANMTDEEKSAFKQQWNARCGKE